MSNKFCYWESTYSLKYDSFFRFYKFLIFNLKCDNKFTSVTLSESINLQIAKMSNPNTSENCKPDNLKQIKWFQSEIVQPGVSFIWKEHIKGQQGFKKKHNTTFVLIYLDSSFSKNNDVTKRKQQIWTYSTVQKGHKTKQE